MQWLRVPAPDVDAAVDALSPDRDRVIDFLRAMSMLVVVSGHALMAVVVWRDGAPRLGNTLAAYPGLQMLTWLLQVLPVFFMVGATANGWSWSRSRRRGTPYAEWLWHRVQRLLRPVIVYCIAMAAVAVFVGMWADPRTADPLLRLTTQLLWFLGAYLWVTAATPWFLALAIHGGTRTLCVLVALVAVVDYLRFGRNAPAWLGLINFLVVWMIAGILGQFLGRGVSRLVAVTSLLMGLGTNLLLVSRAGYPRSLVGLPGDDISNMDPPTLVLVVHTFVLFGAVSLFHPLLQRVLQRRRVWRATVAVNMLMMSIYLWHLPVLTALTWAEHVLGRERPTAWRDAIGPVPADGFWPATVLHLLLFTGALIVLLRFVWIAEYAHLPWWDNAARHRVEHDTRTAVIGIALAGLGISVISATGLVGFPWRITFYEGVPFNPGLAVVLLVIGIVMLRRAGSAKTLPAAAGA